MIRFLFVLMVQLFVFSLPLLAAPSKLKVQLKGSCEYQLRARSYTMNMPFSPFKITAHGPSMIMLHANLVPESAHFLVYLAHEESIFDKDNQCVGESYSLVAARAVDEKTMQGKIMGSSWNMMKIVLFKDGSKKITNSSGRQQYFLKNQATRVGLSFEYQLRQTLFHSDKIRMQFIFDVEENQPTLVLSDED